MARFIGRGAFRNLASKLFMCASSADHGQFRAGLGKTLDGLEIINYGAAFPAPIIKHSIIKGNNEIVVMSNAYWLKRFANSASGSNQQKLIAQ